MTIGQALKDAEQQLSASGIASARLDAQILLEQTTGQDRPWLIAHSDKALKASDAYFALVKQRAKRIPLVHLTGKREFYGLEFEVTPDVLTPRVETEKIVELALKHAPKNGKLIDIGTGSGAIAIVIKKHRPDIDVTATEISKPALKVAKRNAAMHQADTKLVVSDLFSDVEGKFDVVTANLPYLKNDADLMSEVKKEPSIALFGGTDGLDLYRKFFDQLPDHLEPDGLVFIESDPWQHKDLIKIAAKAGLKPIEQDYFILGFRIT